MLKSMRVVAAACALASASAVAAPSFAATAIATFSGTVTPLYGQGGRDAIGLFGAANADLSGLPFTLTYTVDSAGSFTYRDGSRYTAVSGGTGGAGMSPIAASLTINGRSYYFPVPGLQSGAAIRIENNYAGEDSILYYINGPLDPSGNYFTSQISTQLSSSANDFIGSAEIDAPLNYTLTTSDYQYGYAVIGTPDTQRDTRGLRITSVTVVSAVSSAPEPTTWAMMIAGFALVGRAMRRRSATARVAAA